MLQTKRFLEDVAQLCDDRRISVPGTQRLLRKGPYRLFVETGTIPFDDFMFDGRFLVLGSVCNVMTPEGTLNVMRAYGKTAVTELYHVIRAFDERDSEYLRQVLSVTPAEVHADISGQTQRLTTQSLLHLPIPWPDATIRDAYMRFVEGHQEERRKIASRRGELYDEGVELYRELVQTGSSETPLGEVCTIVHGKSLDASLRAAQGGLPVVSSQGIFAFTDEPGVSQPCIVVGQAGQYLLSYLLPDGAFALSDTVALVADKELPLELVYWALYEKGARPKLRVVDHEVDALKASIDSIASLPIAVGSSERWESFRVKAASILREIDALNDRIQESRRFVRSVSSRLLDGDESIVDDLAPWIETGGAWDGIHREHPTAEAPVQVDPIRDAVSASVELVLRSLRGRGDQEVTSFDAAWEVLPLLFLRAVCDDEAWGRIAGSEDQAHEVDRALDELAMREPELGFLPNLGCSSSLNREDERAKLIEMMEGLTRSDISGDRLRAIALEYMVERERRGSVSIERRLDAPCPPAVSQLMAQLSVCFAPQATTLYDPHARTGEIVAAVTRVLPLERVRTDTLRYADTLAATMAWYCDGLASQMIEQETRDVLNCSEDQNLRFDLVVSLLPPNGGEWTDRQPDPRDPRWVFGEPPRNKANLAWLQHAFSHRKTSGYAILGLCDAVLHESRGCEPSVRARMIESGYIRVVIALPGRLFDDGRPPVCLLVLGDSREKDDDAQTLFVDALDAGIELEGTEGARQRMLPEEVVDRIATVVESWHSGVGYADRAGFCRSVDRATMVSQGDLTPWSFVGEESA